MAPSTMKAIKVNGNKATVSDVPLPKLRKSYVLCKVEAIALNPTDWKHIAYKLGPANGTSGCDFAGTVVEVGEGVTKDLKPGDRVAGTTNGANASEPEDGCFAEYAVAKGDILIKIPDSLSFEKAATFPLGTATVGQGLYQKALKLNLPTEPTKKSEPVLIYGGSSATGTLGIQFAKLSGYKVLTTCSPKNNDLVKSFGAEAAFDYKDPNCGKEINKATNDSLKYAWDTISLDSSGKICAEALSSNGSDAKYGTILPGDQLQSVRKDIEPVSTLMYTVIGEPMSKFGQDIPAIPEDFEFAKKLYGITEKLLAEGKLKTHPEKVGSNGLDGALKGMQDMQQDKVSGEKLVYRPAETPKDSKAEVEL